MEGVFQAKNVDNGSRDYSGRSSASERGELTLPQQRVTLFVIGLLTQGLATP